MKYILCIDHADKDSVVIVQSVDGHLVQVLEQKRAKADKVSKEIAKHGVLGRFLRRKPC